MKKLILTAAFSLVGIIAVSAQTETQKKVDPNQTTKPTQPQTMQSNTSTAAQTQNMSTTATVDTSAKTSTLSDATVTNAEPMKPVDATKEEKKAKKKKLK